MIEVNAAALATHPFLHGMSCDQLSVLAEAARDVTFPARQRLFEDGGNATRFWLIQSGHVSLDLHVPGEGPVVIETIGMGELLGWSWLFPPYKWAFGAVAATAVEAFEFAGPGQAVAGNPDQAARSVRLRGGRALTRRRRVALLAVPSQGTLGVTNRSRGDDATLVAGAAALPRVGRDRMQSGQRSLSHDLAAGIAIRVRDRVRAVGSIRLPPCGRLVGPWLAGTCLVTGARLVPAGRTPGPPARDGGTSRGPAPAAAGGAEVLPGA
jgi:hypothetical protein